MGTHDIFPFCVHIHLQETEKMQLPWRAGVLLGLFFLASATSEPLIWLNAPVSVANEQALRVDIVSTKSLHHARVTRVVACTAIDRPFVAYKYDAPDTTGCHSPGFTSLDIFGGQEVTKFRVRQSAQSLYIRKRLLDRHSPLVYLEVHVHLQDEEARTVSPQNQQMIDEWVLVTRFEYPENTLPIGTESNGGGGVESIKAPLEQSGLFASPDEEEGDGKNTSINTSGVHWSVYATFYACVLLGFALLTALVYGRRKELAKSRMRWQNYDTNGEYATKRKDREQSTISAWMAAGVGRGIFNEKPEYGSLLFGPSDNHDSIRRSRQRDLGIV